MTLNIREAGQDDIMELVGLSLVLHELHFAQRPEIFKLPDAESAAEWLHSMLQRPAVRIWIAECNDLPAGFALTIEHNRPENAFCFARHHCEIDQIAVSPAYRGRGLAKALVARIAEDARSRGVPEIELTAWTFNTDGHAAFRALGFTEKTVRFFRTTA